MSEFFFYALVLGLSIIQTSVGIGILVIGTPTLLILGKEMPEIMANLLPLSILTSALNIFYFKLKNKKLRIVEEKEISNIFFLYCLPGIFLGILIINFLNQEINFKIVVSSLILFSVFSKYKFQYSLKNVNQRIKKFFINLIGVAHGLTNSGGTLLTIFILSFGKNKNTNSSRYNVSYFYFYLALFQYFIFLFFFWNSKSIYFIDYKIFLIIFIGCIIGNLFSRFFTKKLLNILIDLLAVTTSLSLLLL
jgi:uncharacterized protein